MQKQREYQIVYEKSRTGWGAYVPDLPGLGVATNTLEETRTLIREGIELHLEDMKKRVKPKAKSQEPKAKS